MRIVEVNNKETARDFIDLPRSIYNSDPNWIPPIESEIKGIFDPKQNSFFQHGTCTRWVLYQNGQCIGRIAAFINNKKTVQEKTGGAGFFECANDQAAANLLFNTARGWLQQHGMKAMYAPINFGENDKYWGLLVEGFKPPSLGMNYNLPYYITLFENFGFKKEYDQLTNFLDATVPMPERFALISDRVMQRPNYLFKHFDKKEFDQFARDFQEIYNDAWHDFENFSPIGMGSIKDSFRQMEPVMDEKIIWFAYYENEPISFILCLPDVNQILKHVNGKLNLLGKLKFLWYKKTTTIDRLRIIVMGCKRRFQNRGVESALIRCLQNEVLPRKTVKGVELAWVGDFNDKMLALHKATGAIKDKVHRTYKYEFR